MRYRVPAALLLVAVLGLSLIGCSQRPDDESLSDSGTSDAVHTEEPTTVTGTLEPEKIANRGGSEYTTDEISALLADLVVATPKGSSESRRYYADAVLIGPALWSSLVEADPELEAVAVDTTVFLPVDPPQELAAGTFQAGTMDRLLDSPALIKLLAYLSGGKVRAATTEEREVFYSLNAYEIADSPISVVERDGVVMLVDFCDGEAIWLELVSQWSR